MSAEAVEKKGPLAGIRVVEFKGLGPGPHAATLLADLGADVVIVQRPGEIPPAGHPRPDPAQPSRRRGEPQGPGGHREGARPGRARRRAHRGLPSRRHRASGPRTRTCARAQPSARVRPHDRLGTGRPLASAAGHDINYISLTGVLHAIGREGERPVPPLNMVGDFGGGSMFLRLRRSRGAGRTSDVRARPGRRRGDGRRRSRPVAHDVGVPRPGPVVRRARRQHARHRRTLLRHLRDLGRQVHRRRRDRAAVLRRSC